MWDLSSPPRDWTQVFCIGRQILYHWASREAPIKQQLPFNPPCPFKEYYSCLHFFSSQVVYHPSQGRAFLRFKFEGHPLQNSLLLWGDQASQVALAKNSPANAGDRRDVDLIPGLGWPPGEGNVNPLQYSCLENPMDRGAWWATVHRVTKSQTRLKQFSTHTLACLYRTSSALWIVYMVIC